MKCWFVVPAVFLFCRIPSYASANEFLSNGIGDSILERPFDTVEMENRTGLRFAAAHSGASHFHLASLLAPSSGRVDDVANTATAYSGRISGARKYLELTPMSGYTFGGEFEDEVNDETIKISDESSVGFRLGYDYEPNSQLEFLYSRQETKLTGGDLFPRDALFDLDVIYYHIGGSLFWNRGSKLEPYFTGTLGLVHMDPKDSGVDSLTRFSMGIGGGVRYFPVKRVGLYTGIRGLVAFVNSDIHVRSQSQNTVVVIEGDTLWQFQVYAGLIFVF